MKQKENNVVKTNSLTIPIDITDKEGNTLTIRLKQWQLDFAEAYVFHEDCAGKPYHCYLLAKNIKDTSNQARRNAEVQASRAMGDAKILSYIRKLTTQYVVNQELMEAELGWLASQRDNLSAKSSALKLFFQKEGLMDQKIEITHKNAPITGMNFVVEEAKIEEE